MIEAEAEHTTLAAQTPIPQISLVQDEKGGPHVFYAVQNGQSLALEQFPSFAAAARAAHTLLAKLPTLHGLRLSVEPGQWALLGSMEPGPEREKELGAELVTPRKFAALLGVGTRTVDRWRREGRIAPVLDTVIARPLYSLESVERVHEVKREGEWRIAPQQPIARTAKASNYFFVRNLIAHRIALARIVNAPRSRPMHERSPYEIKTLAALITRLQR